MRAFTTYERELAPKVIVAPSGSFVATPSFATGVVRLIVVPWALESVISSCPVWSQPTKACCREMEAWSSTKSQTGVRPKR